MIFKVLYQESEYEAPTRERTKSLYVKANSIRDVRKNLSDRNINIEHIQQLDDAHLSYEKQSDHFVLENV